MKVLFLDVDGVLNAHEYDAEAESCTIDRACVKRLNRVIRETGCQIVISSAWRYMILGGDMNLIGFGHMLRTHGLSKAAAASICGHTRCDVADYGEAGPPDERALQVEVWLLWRREMVPDVRFAVVDDMDLGFTAHGLPCVITDGTVGMTDADADRLIELLAPTCSEGGVI